MTQSMGLGELASPEIKFVRKFRWTLKGKHLKATFNNAVHVNYSTKTITLYIMEVVEPTGIHAHQWAGIVKSEKDEELILTTYDGCGQELYARKFNDIEIVNESNDFNYSDSSVSYYKVVIKYGKCQTIPVTDTVHQVTKGKETTVDHLNARLFLGGEQ